MKLSFVSLATVFVSLVLSSNLLAKPNDLTTEPSVSQKPSIYLQNSGDDVLPELDLPDEAEPSPSPSPSAEPDDPTITVTDTDTAGPGTQNPATGGASNTDVFTSDLPTAGGCGLLPAPDGLGWTNFLWTFLMGTIAWLYSRTRK